MTAEGNANEEASMLPFKSLDEATAPGPGATRDLEGSFSKHTLAVTVTGNPSSVEVKLHVSLDGLTWHVPGTATVTDTDYVVVEDGPWRYVRANLNTLVGGTSPTVTAWVASAP